MTLLLWEYTRGSRIWAFHVVRICFPGAARTIYHNPWITADVAEGFWSAGFREIDEYDERGVTPLLMNTHSYGEGRRRMSYWFLQHGAKNLTFPALHNNTLVYKMAADFGTRWRLIGDEASKFWLSDILLQSVKHFPPYPRDQCECFCSNGGCSPVTALMKHFSCSSRYFVPANAERYTRWKPKEHLFRQWTRFCPKPLCGKLGFSDLCRIEAFERLGMRHTCCKFRFHSDHMLGGFGFCDSSEHDFTMLDPSEAAELREEDAYSNVKLQSLMRLYEALDLEYDREFEAFWKTWWAVLNDYVPESNEAESWGTTNLPNVLPLPVDSLDETLLEIRKQITRSMALRRENHFTEGGGG